MSDSAHDPAEPRNPTVAYERTDVNSRAVIWFVTALAAGIVVVMVALVGLRTLLVDRESQEKKSQFPVAVNERKAISRSDPDRLLPPSPRLEGIAPLRPGQEPGRVRSADERPEHEVGRVRPGTAAALYDAQERVLNDTWEWLDKNHTRARIPVEEAMNLLLEKPGTLLKAQPAGNRTPRDGGPPSRSNSGRTMSGDEK